MSTQDPGGDYFPRVESVSDEFGNTVDGAKTLHSSNPHCFTGLTLHVGDRVRFTNRLLRHGLLAREGPSRQTSGGWGNTAMRSGRRPRKTQTWPGTALTPLPHPGTKASPELAYIHDSLLPAIGNLTDPQA